MSLMEELLSGEEKSAEKGQMRRWLAATGGMNGFIAKMEATGNQWFVDALEACSKWVGIRWSQGSGDDEDGHFAGDDRQPYDELAGAEAFGSCFDPGQQIFVMREGPIPSPKSQHLLMFDLDHNAVLLPSSTKGHNHLVIDFEIEWCDYVEVLDVLAKFGIVEPGYVAAAKRRGETFLRYPWIRKHQEKEDAQLALKDWLDKDERPKELQSPEALADYLDPPFRLSDLDSALCTCMHTPNAHIKEPEDGQKGPNYSRYWELTCAAQGCSCENTPMAAMRAGLERKANPEKVSTPW